MSQHVENASLKLKPETVQSEYRFPGKRLLDLMVALPATLIAVPLVLLSALAVRLTSTGPIIFTQTRIGRSGKPFRCYKLRTMFSGSPSVPTHEAHVSYVTPVGRVLRRCKLDELPQLWNVIRGDMSLVGPRPCLPEQAELILHRQIHDIFELEPGITGLAQIRNIDMSNPFACAEADAEYLNNWSLQLDLEILFRTIWRIS